MERSGPSPRTLVFSAVAASVLVVGLAVANTVVQPTRLMGEPANDYPKGQACASGIAINVTFGHVCTQACDVDSECLPSWGCKRVPQGNGEAIGLCFPRRIGGTN